MLFLISFAAVLNMGCAVPFSSLTKITPQFNFFGNQDKMIGNRLGYSIVTNIPSCLAGAGYTPTSIRIAVSTISQPGMTDTDGIKSLMNDSAAKVYYAGQFKTLPCRVSRDVVQVSSKGMDNSFTLTTVLGYQVGSEDCAKTNGLYCNQVLQPGSSYRFNFFVLDEKSNIRAYTDWSDIVKTSNMTVFSTLDTSLTGRSGGMIVITVLLSIALFMLVSALIASLIVGREKSPIP